MEKPPCFGKHSPEAQECEWKTKDGIGGCCVIDPKVYKACKKATNKTKKEQEMAKVKKDKKVKVKKDKVKGDKKDKKVKGDKKNKSKSKKSKKVAKAEATTSTIRPTTKVGICAVLMVPGEDFSHEKAGKLTREQVLKRAQGKNEGIDGAWIVRMEGYLPTKGFTVKMKGE